MQIQLKAASQLAQNLGVKCIGYGPPGTGKTPLVKTCPRPVMCVVEPGMLSMQDADNIPAFEAYTVPQILEFFDWIFRSNETANFDTIVIDSVSQLAEEILKEELKNNKDGRKAYGELSRRVMDLINGLYFLKNKNVYLIAKQGVFDENGSSIKKPFFPGQDLNVKISHLFDEIFHIDLAPIPGQPKPMIAIRSKATYGILARDRSGKLDELEPPNLGAIFKKCKQCN